MGLREEVTGEWRKLHNEDLSALYTLPNIIQVIKSRRTRWAGYVIRKKASGVAYRILVRTPDGKRQFGRPRRKKENNIRMDLQEVGCGGMTELI